MPDANFKAAVTTISTELAGIKTEMDRVVAAASKVGITLSAAAPRAAAEPGFRLSVAFLKFQQGLLAFCSAILGALFIAVPNTHFWGPRQVPADAATGVAARIETPSILGYAWSDLFWRTIEFLVLCIVVATVAAFLTQIFQRRIDAGRGAATWGIGGVTVLAACVGFWAAWPYVLGAWAWRP